MITIHQYGSKYFVFDAKDVEKLRCEYRIIGTLSGTLPQFPLQNTFYGLPLLLLPEEVELVIRHGWAQIVAKKSTSSLCKNPLFNDLWSKGYSITSGIKFGGNYLLYENDPMCTHSKFIVKLLKPDEIISLVDIIRAGRLATNVKKTHVLAGTVDNMMTYYSIDWAGF